MRQNDFYYPDNGCPEASEYIGSQSYCIKCPFAECIYSLKYREKLLILKHGIVSDVLIYSFNNSDLSEINDAFPDIPFTTIRNWLKNKTQIIKKLRKYAGVDIGKEAEAIGTH